MNKIMIMLKPGINAKNFASTMKVSGFKFDSIIPMEKEGSVIVGFCNSVTRAFIKTLPNVEDVEDSHPVHIMLDEDGNDLS